MRYKANVILLQIEKRRQALKLYVISDTHGQIKKALEVYNRLHSIDLIIHLGDMERDARKISERTGKTVISVKGNNEFFASSPENFHILETEYGNLFLTHGHIEGVKGGLQKLLYRTQELGCKAALFGHTHMAHFTETDGIYLLNPGSLTYPPSCISETYAIVNTSENEFSASIVYYNEPLISPTF
jgi:hypothetical protein